MVKIKLAELRDLDRVKEIAEACAKNDRRQYFSME